MADHDVRPNGDRFGEIAVGMGFCTAEQVQRALVTQGAGGNQRLGEILLNQRLLDPRKLNKILLQQDRMRRKSAPAHPPVQPVSRTFGPFELQAKLGEGGMGTVFKAFEPIAQRVVALKVLHSVMKEDPDFLERFQREVRTAGALNHPNIVAAYGAGDVNGTPYLSMEFVDGWSLKVRARMMQRIPERDALTIVAHAAAGLGHAHQRGFLHRDVKPDNILLGKDGSVKVADLGLAKCVDDDQRLTRTGIALGTPIYISPEQARGKREIGPGTDIYSLGASLYHILTGRIPFEGKNHQEVMLKHIKEELENPQDLVSEISDATVAIISKMMAKDPAARYPTCEALLQDVHRVLRGETPLCGMDETPGSSIRPSRRTLNLRRRTTPGGFRRRRTSGAHGAGHEDAEASASQSKPPALGNVKPTLAASKQVPEADLLDSEPETDSDARTVVDAEALPDESDPASESAHRDEKPRRGCLGVLLCAVALGAVSGLFY
jgi:serine/threonine protein kinase